MIHFQHFRRRKYFALADFGCVVLAVALAFYIRTNVPIPIFAGLLPEALPAGFQSFWVLAVSLGSVFVFMQYGFGVYDLWHSSSTLNWFHRVFPANLSVIAFAFTFLYLAKQFTFPSSLLVVVFAVNHSLSTLWRVAYFKIARAEISDVVLVGLWRDINKLLSELSTPPFSDHVRVVTVFVPEYTSDVPPEQSRNYLVLPFTEFEKYTNSNPYTAVILAPSDSFQQHAFNCVLSAARRGVNVYAMPTIYEILMGRLQHLRINDLPLLELRLKPPSGINLVIKRTFDLCISGVALVALTVPMLVLAIMVRLSSTGPAIYSQMRVGQFGKEFRIYKFRTMRVNAERETGAVLSSKGDHRITKFGRILRSTRLDELPQLWNIFLGDMSFVGPRPERPNFVTEFTEQIPGYEERHRIRPGVTGLAQVSGNYVTSPEVKLKYDLAYISNHSLMTDAQILVRTLKTVLTKAGM